MVDTQASEAARTMARCRWGTRGLDHAIDTVIERSAEIGDVQRARLAEIIDAPAGDRDAGE